MLSKINKRKVGNDYPSKKWFKFERDDRRKKSQSLADNNI